MTKTLVTLLAGVVLSLSLARCALARDNAPSAEEAAKLAKAAEFEKKPAGVVKQDDREGMPSLKLTAAKVPDNLDATRAEDGVVVGRIESTMAAHEAGGVPKGTWVMLV